jgi:hypothetical protein
VLRFCNILPHSYVVPESENPNCRENAIPAAALDLTLVDSVLVLLQTRRQSRCEKSTRIPP